MSSNTVAIRVGRLMEISVKEGFRSLEDVEKQRARITAALDTIPKEALVVIAADWRQCQLMSPPAANAMGVMIGDFNARIERSAILGSPTSPAAVLQFLRVVRESRHPARRVYEERAIRVAESPRRVRTRRGWRLLPNGGRTYYHARSAPGSGFEKSTNCNEPAGTVRTPGAKFTRAHCCTSSPSPVK